MSPGYSVAWSRRYSHDGERRPPSFGQRDMRLQSESVFLSCLRELCVAF